MMLISEIVKAKKSVFQLDHSVLSKNQLLGNGDSFNAKFANEDDDEEKFVDVKSDSEGEDKEEEDDDDVENTSNAENEDVDENTNGKNGTSNKKDASWIHKKNIIFKRHDRYDYQERNPLYCGADKTLTYELLPLTRHYHPTVVVFANKLMNEEPVDYTGDPMEDFTLVHFLDRFVYKNPKKSKNKDQPSSNFMKIPFLITNFLRLSYFFK
jgi:ribosome biogenesis protein MAK21